MVEEGNEVPEFDLVVSGGNNLKSSDLPGKLTVIFVYPKDDTSGCTKESIAFSELQDTFREAGADIYGLSPDSLESHEKFISKHDLKVPLLVDEEKLLIKALGVWVEKNMYGRRYMGVDRSTFIIDKEGKVARIWRRVKVPGHAEKVLQAVKELSE
ncbi:MAG: peroxiredoxin [Methyloligellaceae bacterium]